MAKMTNMIAVIPARKDSERLKDKHLQEINGVRLMERAINRCQESGLFDEIAVITNCDVCLAIAEQEDVTGIRRPDKLCTAKSGLGNVFMDAIDHVRKEWRYYRWGCLFQPTHFLVSDRYLWKCYDYLSQPQTNAFNHDQHYGSVEAVSHGFPWFYDLRPGAAILEKKMLQHHDLLGEVTVDIHTAEDVKLAELLLNHVEAE